MYITPFGSRQDPTTRICASLLTKPWQFTLIAAVHDGSSSARNAIPMYRGLADALKSILRREGVRALYQVVCGSAGSTAG